MFALILFSTFSDDEEDDEEMLTGSEGMSRS